MLYEIGNFDIVMQLIGLPLLEEFKRSHADVRGQLDAWVTAVKLAKWATPQDIKNWDARASFLAGNRVIFNVKGNSYRLVVKVRFQNGIVQIEWVGTHAEYDKKKFG